MELFKPSLYELTIDTLEDPSIFNKNLQITIHILE